MVLYNSKINKNNSGAILAHFHQWSTDRINLKSNKQLKWQLRRIIKVTTLASLTMLLQGRKVCSPLWVRTRVKNRWLACWTSSTLNRPSKISSAIKFRHSHATKDFYSSIQPIITGGSKKIKNVSRKSRSERKLHLMKWSNLLAASLSKSASRVLCRIIISNSSCRRLCWYQGVR